MWLGSEYASEILAIRKLRKRTAVFLALYIITKLTRRAFKRSLRNQMKEGTSDFWNIFVLNSNVFWWLLLVMRQKIKKMFFKWKEVL